MAIARQDNEVHVPMEICPQHGMYARNPVVKLLRDEVVRIPRTNVHEARAILADAEQRRAWCPRCEGPAPSMRTWATEVRLRIQETVPSCEACGGAMSKGASAGGFRTHPCCGPEEPVRGQGETWAEFWRHSENYLRAARNRMRRLGFGVALTVVRDGE